MQKNRMALSEIRIYPHFIAHPPKAGKLERKKWQYAESGLRDLDIVLNGKGYLIDGYCAYLIAVEYGLTHVPVIVTRTKSEQREIAGGMADGTV